MNFAFYFLKIIMHSWSRAHKNHTIKSSFCSHVESYGSHVLLALQILSLNTTPMRVSTTSEVYKAKKNTLNWISYVIPQSNLPLSDNKLNDCRRQYVNNCIKKRVSDTIVVIKGSSESHKIFAIVLNNNVLFILLIACGLNVN